MKKSRLSNEEILDILVEGEAGVTTIKKLCRKHGISENLLPVEEKVR